ncbi:MAG TPA: plastocyanin/azurin family copper-binding protein [Bacteroidota bacterium]|nr:plastocyanin/azurin family copper-binding protein [Bacteroidota bacterium]
MIRTASILVLLFVLTSMSPAAKHTVTNVSYTFSPATLTINAGDTVIFSLASIHSAREVSQATWDADANTSDGGFDTPFGGGTVVLTQQGTYYYVCLNHYYMGMKGTITVTSATGVEDNHAGIPKEFILRQNYPNPFNPSTAISYDLPVTSGVVVKVFDIQGKLVETLVEQVQSAGYKVLRWDGSGHASGIYLCRLEATPVSRNQQPFTQVRKMLLVR